MAEPGSRPAPTEGQEANTVGKFYHLTPGQFSSPEEYAKTRDAEYDKWRDSLKTKADYERETGELLPHLFEGDRYQRNNARTALGTIINDSQEKGIELSPETQQVLGSANAAQGSEIAAALLGGRSGMRRTLGAVQRRPGTGQKDAEAQKVEPQKQQAVTSNNVQVQIPKISRQKQNQHIKGTKEYQRRIDNGQPTSAFNNQAEADRYTQEAWQKGTPVPGDTARRDYDFGHAVGTGPNGGNQSIVRVHMDSKGNIHGHPKGPEF